VQVQVHARSVACGQVKHDVEVAHGARSMPAGSMPPIVSTPLLNASDAARRDRAGPPARGARDGDPGPQRPRSDALRRGLSQELEVATVDFLYIPAGMPHQPFNAGDEACRAVIARTDPNEQESVVLLTRRAAEASVCT
jgi:hypothetical protein